MEDIKLFGHKVSPVAAVAVGGGGLVVIWFAWKQHQSSSAASTSASAIDPLTGLPTSEDNTVDPETGETYLAEAQQYGSVAAAEEELSGASSLGLTSDADLYGTSGGAVVGTSTGTATLTPSNVDTGTTYGSNSAWAQAVEAGLTDIGYSSTDVSAALGRYLSNLSETTAQAAIVEAAIAEYGPPPVGSYQVILASTPTPPVTGSTTIAVPNVVGLDVAQATQVLTSAGFKANGPAAVTGVTHVVTAQSPASGSQEAMGTTVDLSYKTVGTSPAATVAMVTVPNVVGEEQSKAYGVLSADGFHPSGPAPVPGKVHTVTGQSPKAGAKAAKGSTVTLTSKLS